MCEVSRKQALAKISEFTVFIVFVAPIVCGGFVLGPCFWYTVLCVSSSFAIISLGKRELVALLFCLLDVTRLILFFDSSSWFFGLVCSV